MALFKAIARNQTLVSLNLGNYSSSGFKNKLGPKAAKYLSEMLICNKVLTFLDLKMTNMCDQGLYQISLGMKQNCTL